MESVKELMETITRTSVEPISRLRQTFLNNELVVMRDKAHSFKTRRLMLKYKIHAKDELQKHPSVTCFLNSHRGAMTRILLEGIPVGKLRGKLNY